VKTGQNLFEIQTTAIIVGQSRDPQARRVCYSACNFGSDAILVQRIHSAPIILA
jgi:hypothetical protein